jgi:hypothetical protein
VQRLVDIYIISTDYRNTYQYICQLETYIWANLLQEIKLVILQYNIKKLEMVAGGPMWMQHLSFNLQWMFTVWLNFNTPSFII